jgi:hypothetical protein
VVLPSAPRQKVEALGARDPSPSGTRAAIREALARESVREKRYSEAQYQTLPRECRQDAIDVPRVQPVYSACVFGTPHQSASATASSRRSVHPEGYVLIVADEYWGDLEQGTLFKFMP